MVLLQIAVIIFVLRKYFFLFHKVLSQIKCKFSVIWSTRIRSSHRCSVRKGVLRNFAKFTGKRLCQSLFFHKVAGLRTATLLKKRLWHRCFPVNFAKFLRTPFLTEHLWLLLFFCMKQVLSGFGKINISFIYQSFLSFSLKILF